MGTGKLWGSEPGTFKRRGLTESLMQHVLQAVVGRVHGAPLCLLGSRVPDVLLMLDPIGCCCVALRNCLAFSGPLFPTLHKERRKVVDARIF